MTIGSQIAWDDTVLPFQLDQSDIRGRVVRLDGVLEQVLSQHSYPPLIEALVAEAALLTALIGQSVKLRWKLSLQIRGNGPARLIATDYYGPTDDGEPARIRAYASYDADRLDLNADPFSQIGTGRRHGALSGLYPDCRWVAVFLCRDLFRAIGTIAHALFADLWPKRRTGSRHPLARRRGDVATHAESRDECGGRSRFG